MTAFVTISELNRAIIALERPASPILAMGILCAMRARLIGELLAQDKDIRMAITAARAEGYDPEHQSGCTCGDSECDRGHDHSL